MRVAESGHAESIVVRIQKRIKKAQQSNPYVVNTIIAMIAIIVFAAVSYISYRVFLAVKKAINNRKNKLQSLPKKEDNEEDPNEEEEDQPDPKEEEQEQSEKEGEKEKSSSPPTKQALEKEIIDALSPELVKTMQMVSAREEGADLLLHVLAYFGWTTFLKRCLATGYYDIEGLLLSKTPLHWAAEGGSTEATKILLAAGANIEAKDSAGYTPLHYAASHGKAAAIKLLIREGAALNAQTKDGLSALHLACQGGSIESVNVPLEAGIDVELKTKTGRRLGIFKYGGETAEEMTASLVSLLYGSEEFVAAKTRADILDVLRRSKKKA